MLCILKYLKIMMRLAGNGFDRSYEVVEVEVVDFHAVQLYVAEVIVAGLAGVDFVVVNIDGVELSRPLTKRSR